MSVSPRVDIAFKKIFGVEENKDLLISLINSITQEEDKVSEVTLLNPYNAQNFKNDKLSILDIKAKGLNGKLYNIEIQIVDETSYDKRALYYWAKLYTEQLLIGQDYEKLNKAIGIHIVNFTNIADSEKYHNVFHITEKETGERCFKDLELHTIELKKFKGQKSEGVSDLLEKIKTALDVWVAFITRHDLLNNIKLPEYLDDAPLKKALDVLEIMKFSQEERDAYEAHLKWLRMEVSAVKAAEIKAEARGEEIGVQKGIQIGELRAIEKMALGMLKKNIDLNLISAITGLSAEQISSLDVALI